MADLTGNAFLQREETQGLKNVAVQKDYRDPDQSAGSEDFAKAGAWDAVGQATGELAKIYGAFDHNHQEARVAEMEEEIQKEFMRHDVGITGSLQDLNATELNPKTKLTDFDGEGLKLPDGSVIKMKALEEYEGYEDLNPAHKRTIKKFYNTSRDQTKNNLMTELTKLSKNHRKLSLGKLSVSVQANNLRILSDPKSYIKEKPMAGYLKKYLDSFGRIDDDFPNVSADEFKQHIFNKIRTGKITDIPGAPSMGGAMPSDIGVKGGLTKEADRNIRIELERLSSKVFDNLGNAIDFEEANVIINKNMQQLLKNQFLTNYNQNPEGAIDKARNGEYRYTREYDGQGDGERQSIEYILDPEILSTYLQQYDSRAKAKATDPEILFRIKQNLEEVDLSTFDIAEYRKKIVAREDIRHKDEKYDIINFAANLKSKHTESVETSDADAIRSEFKIKANEDSEFLYKIADYDEKSKTFKLKPNADLVSLVTDKTETYEKWESPEGVDKDGVPILEGKTTVITKVTKAADRKGIKKLLGNPKAFFDLINSTNEAKRKSDYNVFEKMELDSFNNPETINNVLARYTSADSGFEHVDLGIVTKTWEDDPTVQRIFRGSLTNFLTYAAVMVKKGNQARKTTKGISLKLISGSTENDDALNAALAKKQKIFLEAYVNKTYDAEEANATKDKRDPVNVLFDKMQDQDNDAFWRPEQKERMLMQDRSLTFLADVGDKMKEYDVDQIESQLLDINKRGRGFPVKYHAVSAFAEIISNQLEMRKMELNNSIIGGRVLTEELKTSTYFQDKYPGAWPLDKDEKVRINTMLKHLSTALKGQDSYGKEVDYLSGQQGSTHLLDRIREQDNPGLIQKQVEREYNALRTGTSL